MGLKSQSICGFFTLNVLLKDAIGYWGRLTDAETEKAYRQGQLGDEIRTASIILMAGIVGVLYYIPNDYHFFGTSDQFRVLLALRATICAISVYLVFRLRFVSSPVTFDRLLLFWSICFNLSTIYITTTRPSDYTGHAIVNLFCVLLTYCVFPLPLLLQFIPAFILTTGVIILGFTLNPWPDGPTGAAIICELLTANILGAAVSRQLHRWKRRQFLALRRETELRHSLEHALAEIKTLRGILPICTHCKKVWNDAGFWEQVETYVRDRTHVEFSHGLCPTCARQHYPDIEWDKKGL